MDVKHILDSVQTIIDDEDGNYKITYVYNVFGHKPFTKTIHLLPKEYYTDELIKTIIDTEKHSFAEHVQTNGDYLRTNRGPRC